MLEWLPTENIPKKVLNPIIKSLYLMEWQW